MKKGLIIILTLVIGFGLVWWFNEINRFTGGVIADANNPELHLKDSIIKIKKSNSIDLKEFWNESVEPMIQKDKEKLKEIVEFPLGGEWGFMMELKKDENEWTQSDFFENYNKLFDDKIIRLLKKLNYQDAEIFESEILVGIGWEQDGFEAGIIFRYKKIDGKWKLYVIQAVG